jgi:hypothetical protein
MQCLHQGLQSMDDSSYRRNFDHDKKNETITIAGIKELPKMSKIAKFGCELL